MRALFCLLVPACFVAVTTGFNAQPASTPSQLEDSTATPLAPTAFALRGNQSVWASAAITGVFLRSANEIVLDWGDVEEGTRVTAFEFAYASLDRRRIPLSAEIILYVNENGRQSTSRKPIAWFQLDDLPNGPDPNCPDPNCSHPPFRVARVELASPLVISGPDLDPNDFDPNNPDGYNPACGNGHGHGLVDFGYSLHFIAAPDAVVGPLIAGVDPFVPCTAPGIRDEYDLYVPDPNNPAAPGEPTLPDVNADYAGTLDFGGQPFAQFYFELFTEGNCRRPGCETGDIDPPGGDCDVDLSDVVVLLENFGTPAGATRDEGDIEPAGGDGDIDLADLGLLLADFGLVCR